MSEPWIDILAAALDDVQPDGTPGSFAQALELYGVPALREAGYEVVPNVERDTERLTHISGRAQAYPRWLNGVSRDEPSMARLIDELCCVDVPWLIDRMIGRGE